MNMNHPSPFDASISLRVEIENWLWSILAAVALAGLLVGVL
jgi:hypothetical protein